MYSFEKILIPTDFSPAAWNAVQLGLGLVESRSSQLTLLHVFPSSAKFDRRKAHLNDDDLKIIHSIKEQMDGFCLELGKNNRTKINAVILGGGVENEILKFVDKNRFDLIIMGVNSNGLDNQPGSHISNIIQKANAPVLVIPNKLVKEGIPQNTPTE